MEFVLVTFERPRGVFMDGAPQGQTGQVFGVEAGHHDFDLGNPQDYAPPSAPAVVLGTTPTQPMIIPFHPLPDVRALPAPPPPGARARARKTAKKKTQRRGKQKTAKKTGRKGSRRKSTARKKSRSRRK